MVDVEHIMNFCGFKFRGKFDLKGIFAYGAKDFEGAREVGARGPRG